jgi:hypothetical protein
MIYCGPGRYWYDLVLCSDLTLNNHLALVGLVGVLAGALLARGDHSQIHVDPGFNIKYPDLTMLYNVHAMVLPLLFYI